MAMIKTKLRNCMNIETLGALTQTQPRRPSATSRTIHEDFRMAVGFLFLVLHKESETFLKFSFWITRNKRALLPILVAGT